MVRFFGLGEGVDNGGEVCVDDDDVVGCEDVCVVDEASARHLISILQIPQIVILHTNMTKLIIAL